MKIYTDGSALKNSVDAPAGYAFYISDFKYLQSHGMIGTNNQAELTAILKSLWYVANIRKIKDENILIISDSKYSINILTDQWKATINVELVEKIKNLMLFLKNNNCKIIFKHINSHLKPDQYDLKTFTIDDYKFNSLVDKEANKKAQEMKV